MALATSKNLTILGICTIVGALCTAGYALFDGNPATNPNIEATVAAIVGGIAMLLGKGAASTGGSVPETEEAKQRLVRGFSLTGLLAAVAIVAAVLIAIAPRVARAEDPAPVVSPATLCFNSACSVSATPALGFSGSAYDFEQRTFGRAIVFSGLAEIRYAPVPFGLALGVSFQTGDRQGFDATQLITFPTLPGILHDAAIGVHEMVIFGEKPSIIAAAGYIRRF